MDVRQSTVACSQPAVHVQPLAQRGSGVPPPRLYDVGPSDLREIKEHRDRPHRPKRKMARRFAEWGLGCLTPLLIFQLRSQSLAATGSHCLPSRCSLSIELGASMPTDAALQEQWAAFYKAVSSIECFGLKLLRLVELRAAMNRVGARMPHVAVAP